MHHIWVLSPQTSYESGIKELSAEFRSRLQEELTQREAVEKQLDKQNGLKSHMELSIMNLEADVEEKQVRMKIKMYLKVLYQMILFHVHWLY